MKKVLINASNLHNGGGVQVATSFILDLAKVAGGVVGVQFVVYASSAVNQNLVSAGFREFDISDYRVLDVKGLEALNPSVGALFVGYDAVFTVFGPLYVSKKLRNHIVGFAQPWVIYPDNEISRAMTFKAKLMTRLKYAVHWLFFQRADHLVVELQHVKDRLVALKSFDAERVSVVSNSVSPVFFESSTWKPIDALGPRSGNEIRLGIVSRDYPHKNLSVLAEVSRILKGKSSLRYCFYVTMSEAEWASRSEEFRECVFNVGPLTIAQCPTFYEGMDGVVFPSLLECFSATPLEAMMMRRPLFASDRGFVKDCCGEHARYFDPMNAREIADALSDWFDNLPEPERNARVGRAYDHVVQMPKSEDRSRRYLELVQRQIG